MEKEKVKEQDEIIEGKEQDSELTPVEWLTALVEQNKDDVDFIVNAQNTLTILNSTKREDVSELETLKEENTRLKKKFYESFMGGVTAKGEEIEVIEEEEKPKTPPLDVLLKSLEKGVK